MTHSPTKLAVLLTAAALALAACSSAPESAPQEPAPTVTETVAAEPVAVEPPTESAQDLQLWSITANEVHSTVSEAIEGWDSSGCSANDFAFDDLDPLCEIRLSILETQASTSLVQWRGRLDPDTLLYIETQPESVYTFIEQGNAKIIAIEEAFNSIADTCPDGTGCAGMVLQGNKSLESAESFFSNWP